MTSSRVRARALGRRGLLGAGVFAAFAAFAVFAVSVWVVGTAGGSVVIVVVVSEGGFVGDVVLLAAGLILQAQLMRDGEAVMRMLVLSLRWIRLQVTVGEDRSSVGRHVGT